MAATNDNYKEALTNISTDLKVKRVYSFLGDSFECPWEKFQRPGPIDLLKWKRMNCEPIPSDEILNKTLPVEKTEFFNALPDTKMRVKWIGHATLLLHIDGLTVLTDPVFGTIAAPFNVPFMSYKRYRPAACQVTDLDRLDAVIISHNHYDHLEKSAVVAINVRFSDVRWFVPDGMKEWLVKQGVKVKNVSELEWWQYVEFKNIDFVCTPSQHWCQRTPFDLNKCLWCSWILKGPKHTFYFAGDTGYYEKLFQTIGGTFYPIHLAAIPIGAYNPRSITKFQHVNPEEAVQIHEDIKSHVSIGIHWGTFHLTNEHYLEPPHLVKKEMEKRDLVKKEMEKRDVEKKEKEKRDSEKKEMEKRDEHSKFVCLNIGETWDVGDDRDEPKFMGADVQTEVEESRQRFENTDIKTN